MPHLLRLIVRTMRKIPQLLFGHIFGIRKGAYTGAAEDSPGLMAKADGGILFLDEIHRFAAGRPGNALYLYRQGSLSSSR